MNIFDYWRAQEQQSTMQRLQSENARLRLTGKVDRIVGIVCVAAVLIVAILKINGSLT